MGYFGTISDIDLSKIINVDQEKERTNNRPLTLTTMVWEWLKVNG